METFHLKETPKFKNAEDEIKFLREHIEKREKEIQDSGSSEVDREAITKETLKEYAKLEPEKTLPEKRIIPEHEVQQIVLRLRPEPHDNKMEELLGILMSEGLKNALSILEKLDNPHLDDDFHRFLIQFIHSKNKIPGLKEGTPIFKALNMKLFEVTIPPQAEQEKKGFKEFIGAMEQFYAGMFSVSSDKYNEEQNYFSLEVALSGDSDQVIIYASVPEDKTDLFEKQVLGFYEDAKLREVTDDYNVFSEGAVASGAYAKLGTYEVLPLKTYETIEHDPMNSILNVFSKLKKEGEGAAIQILICPVGDKLVKKFTMVLSDVKDGVRIKHAEERHKLGMAFWHASKSLIFGHKENDETKKINDIAIEKISEKIKSSIVNINIRVISSAPTKERADSILKEIESSFNQFTEAGANSLIFEKINEKRLPRLFHDFSYRILSTDHFLPLNLKELSSIFHFPIGVSSSPQLKEAKAGAAPAPIEMGKEGILLGLNSFRGRDTEIRMEKEDRVRHFYAIGQTGTGKTTILKNMIAQDIRNGDGCCFIDPHGSDIQEILSYIPKERIDDVIYFDPAYTARPMGLNMLEYDIRYPEQKTFVVNELMGIFNKLFDMKTSGGPMFEQYFKNAAFLVMDHPESGATLLEISRVLTDKEFRDMKLSHCKNPIIKQFWVAAEQTTGDQGLANFVPYITSKFDNFISNDIMRPVVLQEKSVFNFRKIMDEKKILLVNLSKGRLGDINANLIGLLLVGKIQMAALSRVDMFGQKINDFYLYIDEFQNVTTDSIASILSEARKYRLSLNIAHQYISQLEDNIKNAVFGNVGSMAVYRVSPEDAEFLEKKFAPTFNSKDIMKLDNFNSYVNMLVKGTPVKPFSMTCHWSLLPKGDMEMVEKIKQLSYLKYGRDREEVEAEIMAKYEKGIA